MAQKNSHSGDEGVNEGGKTMVLDVNGHSWEASVEISRFDQSFPGWANNTESAEGKWPRHWPIPYHAGVASREKVDVLAWMWSSEFTPEERALMSRMRPEDVAAAAFRFPLLWAGAQWGCWMALDDPSSARMRRVSRAALCARRALGAEFIFAPSWIDAPEFEDFWKDLPKPPKRRFWTRPKPPSKSASWVLAALGAGATVALGMGALAWGVGLAGLALAHSGGRWVLRALRSRQKALEKAAALAALAQAYPDVDVVALFEDLESGCWPMNQPMRACQAALSRDWNGDMDALKSSWDEPSARDLLMRLSDHQGPATWPEFKARAARETFELRGSCAAAVERSNPARRL